MDYDWALTCCFQPRKNAKFATAKTKNGRTSSTFNHWHLRSSVILLADALAWSWVPSPANTAGGSWPLTSRSGPSPGLRFCGQRCSESGSPPTRSGSSTESQTRFLRGGTTVWTRWPLAFGLPCVRGKPSSTSPKLCTKRRGSSTRKLGYREGGPQRARAVRLPVSDGMRPLGGRRLQGPRCLPNVVSVLLVGHQGFVAVWK